MVQDVTHPDCHSVIELQRIHHWRHQVQQLHPYHVRNVEGLVLLCMRLSLSQKPTVVLILT